MNIQAKRLIEAVEHFQTSTKGSEDISPDVAEAVSALHKALGLPAPDRNTPGARAALKVVPGTKGTGENFAKAARGIDGPSPGQRQAQSLSQQISEAAAEIASRNQA
ncbi:MAG: hypothetical protein JSS68_15040 [Actinobacteria bacterium]|nr:hypothetical protein [Actinomycetota bacterium]